MTTDTQDRWVVICDDCGAEYIGSFAEAAEAGWEWVTEKQMACPDCMDELYSAYDPEADSSATSFEVPEWSKETPK